MELPKVTIQIATWNSIKYLPDCLKSIFDQTYKNFQVLVIDNNSQDESVSYIKKNYPEVTVFENKKNLGFARANNQGVRLLHSPYVLFCNVDIVLMPNWLENIMEKVELEKYSKFGSFGGKLLKLELIDGEVMPESMTDTIDSCGLKMLRNRRVVEIGAGKKSDEFKDEKKVFGHSGALVLYRRQALDDLLVKTGRNPSGEYFDEDFYLYKEDVDLAWRAQLFGWESVLIPDSVAYHARSTSGSESTNTQNIIKNRKKQSSYAKYYSYRNHILMLLKNEFGKNFMKNFWPIMWFELKKAGYILFFEFRNAKAFIEIIKMIPKMRVKRKEIMRRAKVSPGDIASWVK